MGYVFRDKWMFMKVGIRFGFLFQVGILLFLQKVFKKQLSDDKCKGIYKYYRKGYLKWELYQEMYDIYLGILVEIRYVRFVWRGRYDLFKFKE